MRKPMRQVPMEISPNRISLCRRRILRQDLLQLDESLLLPLPVRIRLEGFAVILLGQSDARRKEIRIELHDLFEKRNGVIFCGPLRVLGEKSRPKVEIGDARIPGRSQRNRGSRSKRDLTRYGANDGVFG